MIYKIGCRSPPVDFFQQPTRAAEAYGQVSNGPAGASFILMFRLAYYVPMYSLLLLISFLAIYGNMCRKCYEIQNIGNLIAHHASKLGESVNKATTLLLSCTVH
jgi:hypothetical protein